MAAAVQSKSEVGVGCTDRDSRFFFFHCHRLAVRGAGADAGRGTGYRYNRVPFRMGYARNMKHETFCAVTWMKFHKIFCKD